MIAARLLLAGFVVGMVSGFFGIGGGFLIVPGIMLGSGLPILNAIGSSLLSVSAFGLTTAGSYAFSGLVNWGVALQLILGGAFGGFLGTRLALRLGAQRRLLERIFAGTLLIVAVYVAVRAGIALRH